MTDLTPAVVALIEQGPVGWILAAFAGMAVAGYVLAGWMFLSFRRYAEQRDAILIELVKENTAALIGFRTLYEQRRQ